MVQITFFSCLNASEFTVNSVVARVLLGCSVWLGCYYRVYVWLLFVARVFCMEARVLLRYSMWLPGCS